MIEFKAENNAGIGQAKINFLVISLVCATASQPTYSKAKS